MGSHARILATVAAGTSLLLHALLFSASRSIRIPIPGAPAAPVAEAEMMVFYVPPETEYTIGEADAKGYASHKVEGTREAVSPEAPADQAALSLDPVGRDLVVEKPEKTVGRDTPDALAMRNSPPRLPRALESVQESIQSRVPQVVEALRERALSGELAQAALPEITVPAPAPGPAPAPASVPPAPAVAFAGGGQADPAPLSDSESDAFSVLGSAQYRDGRLSVRAGRKVKSRRPRIGLAGQVDLYQHKGVQVTLRVATNAEGKVTAVDVVRSSGSNEIDQPCRVAMYDWWFEPKKDAAGNPVPDKFDFTIGFH